MRTFAPKKIAQTTSVPSKSLARDVLIQGWFLSQPHTGIGVYTIALTHHLARQNPKIQFHVLSPVVQAETALRENSPSNLHFVHIKPWTWIPHHGLQKALWELLQVPFKIGTNSKLRGAFFSPYPSPLFAAFLPKKIAPLVMTAHDTFLWDDPRYEGGFFKRIYHKLCLRAFQRATQRITISETTRKNLQKAPYHQAQVHVILNGKPSWKNTQINTQKNTLRSGQNAARKNLLYVGGFDARKQFEKLLDAFEKVAEQRPQWSLQVVGKLPSILAERVQTLQKRGLALEILGDRSDSQLKRDYEQAWVWVHASDAEGFNLPLLEAMSMGIPAVVSDRPIHHEISGETARFWEPSQSETFFAKLQELENPISYEAQQKAQMEVAARYSWANAAQTLIKILQS